MSETTLLRTRIDARRKTAVEEILTDLGLTPAQAINLFFAQIERRRAIPFPLSLEDHRDILPPLAQTAALWDELDDEDFSHLDPR